MTVAASEQVTPRLKELFAAQIEGVAAHMEPSTRAHLGGSRDLLDETEIADACLELQELLAEQLRADDPFSKESPQFQALDRFFGNLARKVFSRGGEVDALVRYVRSLQRDLIAGVEALNDLPFTRSRSVLAFFSDHFTELLLTIFRTYLDQKDVTIRAQESELRETATPITEIWSGVITLPIIGTLDSSRTLLVMESLLNRIARDQSKVVVMDLTGVGSIDSQVSHHLIQMVRAIQLMGAEAILTGIRPEIARALTHLEIDLGNVRTRASLADGLRDAFRILGVKVVSVEEG